MSLFLKKIFLLFVIFFSPCCLHASKKIASDEATILAPLYHLLLKHSETGYVLLNAKPLCTIAYSEYPFFFEDFDENDQLSVAVYSAQSILKQHCFNSGNIIFHYDEKEKMLLIINRKLFLKTIDENLSLFQYVLGPFISSEILLKELLSQKVGFAELFNYDRVLIGIVLGYGVQNALINSRYENIKHDEVFASDLPPFTPHQDLVFDLDKKKDLLFLDRNEHHKWEKKHQLKPSLGFFSLKEESEEIFKKIDISSQQLRSENPRFIFNCLKESKKSNLILTLETTQEKIKKLSQSSTCLEKMLGIIFQDEVKIEKKQATFLRPNNYNLLIAKLLRNELKKCEKSQLKFFAEGLLLKENEIIKPCKYGASTFDSVANMKIAKKNLDEADKFFSELNENANYIQIIQNGLYYKILEEGIGQTLKGERSALFSFEIKDSHGNCLNSGKELLEIHKTFQGFANGVQGMKKGEKRKIYIHPSLAYGVHTYLEKGIYLEANVTLHEIFEGKNMMSRIEPIDFSFIKENDFIEKCENEYNQVLKFIGKKKSAFLKLCPNIEVDTVANIFLSFDDQSFLSEEDLKDLNHYFWNLYFANK